MRCLAHIIGALSIALLIVSAGACSSDGGDSINTGTPVSDAGVSADGTTTDNGACVPVCAGRVCGDDGCGGSCGTCAGEQVCDGQGLCQDLANCTDTCESTEAVCGEICGAPCGLCTAAESCINYQCEALPEDNGPDSDASGSGDDPVAVCGDGTCDTGETCSACPGDCGACPPAPECGDGTCNGTETCLTCTDDCGECADEQSYYCFELNACLVDGCDPNAADFQTCAQGNMGSCQAAAVTPKDWSDWFAWQQCLGTCMGQTPTPEQQNQCLEYGCPTEVAECFSGGTYGEATCAELDTCMNQTCGMVPADQQSKCIRDCMATGTEDAVSQQVAILFCASNACAQETTAAGQQACLQAALQADGACADPVSICMGGAGTCEPDCTDKACGDDGCGGTCGECAEGETCSDAGACEAGTCEPDCTDKACGDDGCGASCGECTEGETCSEAGTCEASAPTPTLCESYCEAVAANCTDENVLTWTVDCATDCAGWPEGADGDIDNNTTHCRLYHATAAADDPALHCPHASPDGGGVCVD